VNREHVVSATPSKNALIVLSAASSRGLEWALRVLNSKSPESLWIVVDEKTMKTLAKRGVTRALGERIMVYSGKKLEEFSLRVLVITKPDELYLCDERGVFEPLTRLLRLLRVSVYEC
jgi:Holliday junction resolvasome RuvABC DNA-binding subunit